MIIMDVKQRLQTIKHKGVTVEILEEYFIYKGKECATAEMVAANLKRVEYAVKHSQRINAAKWLNSIGYDIELDKDGFWMEEYNLLEEHKVKDILDLMIKFKEAK